MTNLQRFISAVIAQHSGVRPAARVLDIDAGYLSRLRDGKKVNPSNRLLRRLGLRKIVTVRYVGIHEV